MFSPLSNLAPQILRAFPHYAASNSINSHTWSVSPAAMAGVCFPSARSNATEIAKRHVQRNRVFHVLQRLTECVFVRRVKRTLLRTLLVPEMQSFGSCCCL